MERRSAQTASTYKLVVETFLHWCVENRIKLSAVTIQNLIYFLAWRRTNNCSPLTIAKDISALRAFGSYLVRQKIWKENLVFMLDRPKASRSLPKVLSVEQVETLLSVVDTSTPIGKRDAALFEMIYSCGLRISEACTLLVDNLHLNEQLVMVCGKGDKERIVPFGEAAKKKLEAYLDDGRPDLVGRKVVREVFVNYKGDPISRKGVWKRFQELEAALSPRFILSVIRLQLIFLPAVRICVRCRNCLVILILPLRRFIRMLTTINFPLIIKSTFRDMNDVFVAFFRGIGRLL